MAGPNPPKRGEYEILWRVPRAGVLANIPVYEIPDDALHDSLNAIVRGGVFGPRPGLTLHNNTSLQNRPMGAFTNTALSSGAFQADAFQNDAFQVTGVGSGIIPVVGTTRKIWAYYSGNWVDITGTPLTGGETNHVRFTGIELFNGSVDVVYTLIANGVDQLRIYDNVSPTVSLAQGSPPIFTDLTTIANHIIGIIPPFDVRWSGASSISSWAALNFYSLSDTPDRVVAIKNMGTLQGVIYKERSVWSVLAIGGTDATFFRFELRGFWEGPVSPAAVVEASGAHYWMTKSGRVGMFDGVTQDWVADGVWDIVRKDVDSANMNRSFAVYEPFFDELYFYYPRLGDAGQLKGGVCVIRPRPKDGILSHIAFPFRLSVPVSAGTDLRLEANKALLFRSDTMKSYTVEGSSDAEEAFTGFWQTGLTPTPGLQVQRLEEMEIFAHRGAGSGVLAVFPISSNILDTHGGTPHNVRGEEFAKVLGQVVNLSDASPVRDVKGANVTGRFFGLRCEFTTPVDLQFVGARVTARKVE